MVEFRNYDPPDLAAGRYGQRLHDADHSLMQRLDSLKELKQFVDEIC